MAYCSALQAIRPACAIDHGGVSRHTARSWQIAGRESQPDVTCMSRETAISLPVERCGRSIRLCRELHSLISRQLHYQHVDPIDHSGVQPIDNVLQPPDGGTCLEEATRVQGHDCLKRSRPGLTSSRCQYIHLSELAPSVHIATMVLNGFLASFIAAVQASLSVLLVISYGAIAARLGLLNASNGKAISKICVKMFLPALLLVQIGSELHPGSASRYLIILLWAIICHFASFLIGIFAHLVFGLPDWTTAAIMFNNTTSYPLLLIQSLEQTGILSKLLVEDETTGELVARAKSYFLVFATVSSCLTFAVGPRLIDTEHAPDSDDESTLDGEESNSPISPSTQVNEAHLENGTDAARPSEQTRLLSPGPQFRERHKSVTNITFFPSKPRFTTVKRRPRYIPDLHWSDLSARTQWWLLFFYDFLNAPLVGALLGVVIGTTSVLHHAFFNNTYSGGIFTAWLTESWKNIGGLFVPLPLIVAGISLYTSYQDSKHGDSSTTRSNTPLVTTAFILTVRFIVWPVVSIGVIYAIAKDSNILGSEPMLWFAMMLMPTGPPAMKLITMVQVSDAGIEDERKIAKILTISYIISPILAVVVVGALYASEAAI